MPFQNFLDVIVGQNTVRDIGMALMVFLGVFLALEFGKYLCIGQVQKIARRTKNTIDDAVLTLIREIKSPVCAAVALYVAIQFVVLPGMAVKVIQAIVLVAVVYEILRFTERFFDFVISRKFTGGDGDHVQSLIHLGIRIALWVTAALLILSNLGLDITSLIASLGIGGIAIALALQNILGDLFSAFSIYFDKPFQVGDFIVIGEHMGVVKKIGLKTTRIEAIGGEELIVPNTELTGARVQNFKRLRKRRVPFTFGVTYDTSLDKMQKIPDIVKKIIEKIDNATFDRVHFRTFAESSLEFEVVYFVQSGDYNMYCDIQQDMNFRIVEAFAKEGIAMAFPTRTVHLVKGIP